MLLSHCGPCGLQAPMGLLELLVEVLQVLLQHPVALLQLLVFGAGSLLHAAEAAAPHLQLRDGDQDTSHPTRTPMRPTPKNDG